MIYFLIAAFAYWFAALSGVPQYVSGVLFNFGVKKKYAGDFMPIRLKPFDCEKCLAFWLAIWYGSFHQQHLWELGLYSGITSLMAIIVSRLYNKIA